MGVVLLLAIAGNRLAASTHSLNLTPEVDAFTPRLGQPCGERVLQNNIPDPLSECNRETPGKNTEDNHG